MLTCELLMACLPTEGTPPSLRHSRSLRLSLGACSITARALATSLHRAHQPSTSLSHRPHLLHPLGLLARRRCATRRCSAGTLFQRCTRRHSRSPPTLHPLPRHRHCHHLRFRGIHRRRLHRLCHRLLRLGCASTRRTGRSMTPASKPATLRGVHLAQRPTCALGASALHAQRVQPSRRHPLRPP